VAENDDFIIDCLNSPMETLFSILVTEQMVTRVNSKKRGLWQGHVGKVPFRRLQLLMEQPWGLRQKLPVLDDIEVTEDYDLEDLRAAAVARGLSKSDSRRTFSRFQIVSAKANIPKSESFDGFEQLKHFSSWLLIRHFRCSLFIPEARSNADYTTLKVPL
jgi:hypothetical protein